MGKIARFADLEERMKDFILSDKSRACILGEQFIKTVKSENGNDMVLIYTEDRNEYDSVPYPAARSLALEQKTGVQSPSSTK